MLKSVARNKSRLGREGAKYKLYEDDITSTIFSPWEFMAVDDAWACLKILFEGAPDNQAWKAVQDKVPSKFKIEFWRSKAWLGNDSQRVEPDICITVKFSDCSEFFLIIEVKWDSGASNHESGYQLERQWKSFVVDEKGDSQKQCAHIYLVKNDESGEFDTTAEKLGTNWKSKAWRCYWIIFRRLLDVPRNSTEAVKIWREDSSKFLENIGIFFFSGFSTENNLTLAKYDKELFLNFPRIYIENSQ